ncbi:MAG: hypothetical protein VB099_06780 [Candidatus Limiplasma sp.]|nr:hypothetical protein [Candidatus Limiplasma sp.]
MKKRRLVVMLLLVMMVSSVALAERTPFNIQEIPCNASTPLMDWTPVTRPCSQIYVRHYIWEDIGGSFTNYFWAGLNGTNVRYGGAWMVPDTTGSIKSSSIGGASTYRVIIRPNTVYADFGLESMHISGYAEPMP